MHPRVTIILPLVAALASAAQAASPGDTQDLKNQIQAMQSQFEALKKSSDEKVGEMQKKLAAFQEQYATEKKKDKDAAVRVSLVNGSPTISSSDNAFSISLTGLMQADYGYYMQGSRAKTLGPSYGPDLSSGTNIRRSAIGVRGRMFSDWSYMLLYNFGNSATETPGGILYSYLQYDGFGPLTIRAGAIAPPSSIEDGTSPADLMFIERNSSSNLQRNIAGAEGRAGVTVAYAGDRLFAALSYSGGKVQDPAVFDEQMAVVGRLSYLAVADQESDRHLIVGGNFVHVFKLQDMVAGGNDTLQTSPSANVLHCFTLADFPELTVDSTASKLVNTGSLPANHVTSAGLETAGNWKNFYVQSAYYLYQIDRAPVAYNVYTASSTYAAQTVHPSDNVFHGWYVQASWVLTGESKPFIKSTSAFGSPKPFRPLSVKDGGWGAWELAARYSTLNLNSHENSADGVVTGWSGVQKSYTFFNTVRGGNQRIATVGLNWYPVSTIRLLFNYLYVDTDRTQAPGFVISTSTPDLPAVAVGQSYSAAAVRLQVSF
jgi:phosphate-selective porin OprO/OprP